MGSVLKARDILKLQVKLRCVDVSGNLCFVTVFTVNKFSTQLFFFIFNSTLTFCTLLLRKGDKYSCITLFEVRKLLVKKKKSDVHALLCIRCSASLVLSRSNKNRRTSLLGHYKCKLLIK